MKTEQDGWKTKIEFLFREVNFHDQMAQNDEGSKIEIKDFFNRYFNALCNKTEIMTDFLHFFQFDVHSNIAGKIGKFSSSLEISHNGQPTHNR